MTNLENEIVKCSVISKSVLVLCCDLLFCFCEMGGLLLEEPLDDSARSALHEEEVSSNTERLWDKT